MRAYKCPDCEMLYVPELAEERRTHREFHNELYLGLRARPLKNEMVVWSDGACRIIVVNFNSPQAQKRRANRAGSVSNRDSHYDFPPYVSKDLPDHENIHFFLLYERNRIIGIVVLIEVPHLVECTWEEYERGTVHEVADHPVGWAVGRIWVCRDQRRKGFARRLLIEASGYFRLKPQNLAWNHPFSENGTALAKSVCSESIRLV